MQGDDGKFYLIDYGISKILPKNGIKSADRKGFVGTPRYASISAHLGIDQGPKNDLESFFYVIAQFYLKVLPWMGLPLTPSRTDNILKLKS